MGAKTCDIFDRLIFLYSYTLQRPLTRFQFQLEKHAFNLLSMQCLSLVNRFPENPIFFAISLSFDDRLWHSGLLRSLLPSRSHIRTFPSFSVHSRFSIKRSVKVFDKNVSFHRHLDTI